MTQYASVRAHIMDLLGQVQDLLETATLDGEQLAEMGLDYAGILRTCIEAAGRRVAGEMAHA